MKPLISLHAFKNLRRKGGTPYSFYYSLSKAGLADDVIDNVFDSAVAHFGFRVLEKAKSSDLYDLLDGFIVGYTEPLPTLKKAKATTK